MNLPPTRKTRFVRKVWEFLASKWIGEVPDDIACCEFNCRKLYCEQGEWETCEHRLKYMAAGQTLAEKGPQEHQASDTERENIGESAPRKL